MRRGVALLERLVASPRFGPDSMADAASGYQTIFRYYLVRERFDEAERYARKALDLARRDVATGRPQARTSLARVLSTHSDVLRATGRLEESLATARDSGTMLDEEGRLDPSSMLVRMRRMVAYNREGLALADIESASLGRWSEADTAQQRVVDAFRSLVAEDPGNMDARTNLTEVLIWQARSWRIRGNLNVAENKIAEARVVADAITDKLDVKKPFQTQIAVERGHLLRARGRLAEAWERVREAQALLGAAASDRALPACDSPAASVIELNIVLGMDQGDAVDDRARHFASALRARPFDVLNHATCLSWRLDTLRASAARAGRADLARDLENRRTEISRHWRRRLPAALQLPWQLSLASSDR
jgi:hypothetical protein